MLSSRKCNRLVMSNLYSFIWIFSYLSFKFSPVANKIDCWQLAYLIYWIYFTFNVLILAHTSPSDYEIYLLPLIQRDALNCCRRPMAHLLTCENEHVFFSLTYSSVIMYRLIDAFGERNSCCPSLMKLLLGFELDIWIFILSYYYYLWFNGYYNFSWIIFNLKFVHKFLIVNSMECNFMRC